MSTSSRTYSSPAGLKISRLVLDEEGAALEPDPLSGEQVGACEVHGRLVRGETRTMLAFRFDATEGASMVLMRRLDPGLESNAELLADAQAVSTLRVKHLENVYGIEKAEGVAFWVSEFVNGATLSDVRLMSTQKGVPFSMGFALAAVADAVRGLHQLHLAQKAAGRPSVHGFLRPQNIVMTFSGAAKLLYPRYIRVPPGTTIEQEPLSGNAGYLSPEQIRGQPLDARSDVFSMAVLAYEALTERTLFQGRSARERADATLQGRVTPPSQLKISLPREVDAVMEKALSLERNARYPDANEFLRAFNAAAGGFMWKEAQRAQTMEQLFSIRVKRIQQIQAALTERHEQRLAQARAQAEAEAAARAAEEARQAQLAAEEARQAQLAAEKAAEAARIAEQQRRAAAEAAAAANAPPVLTAGPGARTTTGGAIRKPGAAQTAQRAPEGSRRQLLIAAAAGGFLILVVLGWLLFRPSPPERGPVVAAPPPVMPTPIPVAGVDAGPALDGGEEDGGTSDGGTVSAATEDDGGTSATGDGGTPVKKKKRQNLPPWLR